MGLRAFILCLSLVIRPEKPLSRLAAFGGSEFPLLSRLITFKSILPLGIPLSPHDPTKIFLVSFGRENF